MWRLFSSIWEILFGRPREINSNPETISAAETIKTNTQRFRKKKSEQTKPRLPLLKSLSSRSKQLSASPTAKDIPYRYAQPLVGTTGVFLDLSQDIAVEKLARWDLPSFQTPADLADWLELPLGHLAWLTDRFGEAGRPVDVKKAHYRYSWKQKKTGGYRLIEAPLPLLKQLQEQILDEILCQVPVHPAAHGFCAGKSILTNAKPHQQQAVVLKLDLDNFYARVRFSRVVAMYREFGYSREIALWLAKLTTSAIPNNLEFPGGQPKLLRLFLPRHLPQGAPSSPAIANLVAFGLDVRLFGLARSFNAHYTRYGDDLTFSGDVKFRASLRLFIPLVRQIIRQERFRIHPYKRRVLRPHDRQTVTGVVVNQKLNYNRQEYDRLKAILHNCIRTGPAAQNRAEHDNFAAHLRGKIAFVQQINPVKGGKLLALYQQISWNQ